MYEIGRMYKIFTETKWPCKVAENLGCPTIQLVIFCGLKGRLWSEILKLIARNIADIADIGRKYKIKFQLEPIAWSPMYSLSPKSSGNWGRRER